VCLEGWHRLPREVHGYSQPCSVPGAGPGGFLSNPSPAVAWPFHLLRGQPRWALIHQAKRRWPKANGDFQNPSSAPHCSPPRTAACCPSPRRCAAPGPTGRERSAPRARPGAAQPAPLLPSPGSRCPHPRTVPPRPRGPARTGREPGSLPRRLRGTCRAGRALRNQPGSPGPERGGRWALPSRGGGQVRAIRAEQRYARPSGAERPRCGGARRAGAPAAWRLGSLAGRARSAI